MIFRFSTVNNVFKRKIMENLFIEHDNFMLDKAESMVVLEFFDSIFEGFFGSCHMLK